jgi:hypothetical protein
MKRVRLDAIQDQAGVLYHHGQPFNGVAYEVRADRVTANYQVVDGVRNGPAEVWNAETPRVLFQALTVVSGDETDENFPEEGAYLNGVPFHGIAFVFEQNTGVLLREQDLHPTQPGPSREWYPFGAIKAEFDRARGDGTTESETWHENGQSATIESSEMGVGHTSEGHLRTLRLELGCTNADLTRVSFRADSVLDLAGPGITDEVIERLTDLPRVEDLELHRTKLSASGLGRFHACTNLKKFRARRNVGFGEADVRNLLACFPNCAWDGLLR